jgi:hypothetical protein
MGYSYFKVLGYIEKDKYKSNGLFLSYFLLILPLSYFKVMGYFLKIIPLSYFKVMGYSYLKVMG